MMIKKFVNFINKSKEWFIVTTILFLSKITVFASSIGDSKLATGTEKLIKDATSWLLIIAPLVTVVAIIYYLIRKTMSDEMDHKKWNSRITTAIICCVGVVAASITSNLIVSYYQ